MTSHANIGGSWKNVSEIYANIGGSWKEVTEGYTKVSGVWQQWLSSNPPASLEYLVVNDGAQSGGFFEQGSLSVSLGQSETVVVGSASSLTSVAAPTDYNGSSYNAGADTIVRNFQTVLSVWRKENGDAVANGGGAGGAGNGSGGSFIYNGSFNPPLILGGDGGQSASVFGLDISGGIGGNASGSGGWRNMQNFQYYDFVPKQGGISRTSDYGGFGSTGVVIVRYPDTFDDLTSATVAPVTANGYKTYTFESSGSFTV